jgi:hypothetical protein
MMHYGIPATRVVAYTYEADYHCVTDAIGRFGRDDNGFVPEDVRDAEGNPIGAIFTSDLDTETVAACADCGQIVCLACGVRSERAPGSTCWNCATEWRTEGES